MMSAPVAERDVFARGTFERFEDQEEEGSGAGESEAGGEPQDASARADRAAALRRQVPWRWR